MEATISDNDTRSTTEPTNARKPGRWRMFIKYGLFGLGGLAAALLLTHLVWHNTGSGQWELTIDRDGIKVWSQKHPGTDLVLVKASTQVDARLASMVKLLEDLDSCVDAGCYDAQMIQRLQTPPGQYAAYVQYKFDMPIPGLETQQYVLFQEHYQDPETKKLTINLMAAPNRIPRDDCCVRVTHLYNTWEITPLPDGKLDILFMQDTDVGGVPYPLANLALTEGTYEALMSVHELMKRDKYANAQISYIDELNAL